MKLKPHALLDELKIHGGISSDRKLAELLRVAPPVISKVRNGTLEVGDTFRVRIMRAMGWTLGYIDKLSPPGAAEAA